MAKVKILKHSVVISGFSFDDCKAEYDKICRGVKKDFGIESGMQKLIFSDMTIKEDECVAIFQMPKIKYNYMNNVEIRKITYENCPLKCTCCKALCDEMPVGQCRTNLSHKFD